MYSLLRTGKAKGALISMSGRRARNKGAKEKCILLERLNKYMNANVNDEVYENFRSDISMQNLASLQRQLVSMTFVFLVMVVVQLFIVKVSFFEESIFLLGVFGGSLPIFLSVKGDLKANGTIAMYIWGGVILTLDAFFEAAFFPDDPGFLFPILMLIFIANVMDRPKKVLIYDLSMSGLYVLLKILLADPAIFMEDILRLIIIDCVVLSSNFRIMNSKTLLMRQSDMAIKSAEHDALTGIMNRRGGDAMIRAYLANGVSGTFILMDIDCFKHVNDTYGHAKGDEVIKDAAHILSQAFRSNDVVMRMGGDEFIVYATGIEDYHSVEQRLEMIRQRMHTIVLDSESGDHVSVSMGCAINHGSYPSYEALYNVADRMLYAVKENGKDGYRITEADFRQAGAIPTIDEEREKYRGMPR